MYLDLCAMKYICVLLSSLVLAVCSGSKFDDQNIVEVNNGNRKVTTTFNDLHYKMIRLINTFMEPKDIVNWRCVNCLTFSSLSLKKLVEQLFNISGLESISDNEPELAGVMALAHTSHDPVLFFSALMEDVVCEKKPYEVLFSPLMLYIIRTFRALNPDEKQNYEKLISRKFHTSVEKYLTEICVLKGLFDLVFEIVRGDAGRVGEALCYASKSGHTPMVELLLQRGDDISANDIGWALYYAAKSGQEPLVKLLLQCGLLQRGDDKYVLYMCWAFSRAVKYEHAPSVELLILHCKDDISADVFECAFYYAAENGHTLLVELFILHYTDISADYAGWALRKATEGGHASMVELLLQRFTEIPANHVGWALYKAVEGGHVPIVELLFQRCDDISTHYVRSALRKATEGGHTLMVELFLKRFTRILAKHVELDLHNVAEGGQVRIVYDLHYKFDDQNIVEVNNGNRKVTFNDLRYEMIRHIATFIEPEDIVNWRCVNCLTFSSLSLKKLVEQLFNISGLESISDNEPELAGVMELAHTSHDPVLFFTALMEDVVCGKKPYEVLFSPLMLYIIRTFRELDPDEKHNYEQLISIRFHTSVGKYFTEICTLKGLFDLVFEIVRGDSGRVGEALYYAAKSGQAPLVELLLQRGDDISANDIGWALNDAADIGHAPLVELLLQRRNVIPAQYIRWALCVAINSGNAPLVELLLIHGSDDISADDVLYESAENGHTLLVELFILHYTDISADYAGWALRKATEGGHASMVEHLLQRFRFTEIPANHVGWALYKAVEGGHVPIVELLFQRCDDISTHYVRSALRKATEGGHTLMVEIILQHRTDISA
jgi:hypothetical protein